MNYSNFIDFLINTLKFHYDHRVCPAHDLSHSKEMIRLGLKIRALPLYRKLDLEEFEVACLIHSTDRSSTLRELIGFTKGMPDPEFKSVWGKYLRALLSESPFDEEAQSRIVTAVLQHAKKDDDPKNDSILLTCLRIADKVVRFGPLGIMAIAANHRDNPFYEADMPFNYTSTDEKKLKSVYNDFCRVLEWFGMLPSDEARSLISPEYLQIQVTYQRQLGQQIAEITGKRNDVEIDIKKAMGEYYNLVKIA